MTRRPFPFFVALALLCSVLAAAAGPAGVALAQTPRADSAADFIRDVEAFKQKLPGLSPEQAAAEWLAFADREATLAPPPPRDDEEDNWVRDEPQATALDKLMAALPPPSVELAG